jgi:hypothetical protein
MNWYYGLDLDVLGSKKGFLMIEVILSGMLISIMTLLLYQLVLILMK